MRTSYTVRVVRASAVYDLVITAPFVLPWTASLVFTALSSLHEVLGLRGTAPYPDDVFAVMFANLMGSIVVVWAGFRLIRPSVAAGLADTAARLLFSVGMAAALIHGASPLTGGLLALEVAWAVVQSWALVPPLLAAGRAPAPV